MSRAFLGLGSNLGDRRWHLAEALRRIAADPAIALVCGSSLYETKPVGLIDQPDFLNLVVQVETSHDPLALLAVCQGVEAGLGRERRERWGPRTIDIDLLVCGDGVMNDDRLVLPHPRMTERGFVLIPLAEISPELVVAGKSVREHAVWVDDQGLTRVEPWAVFSQWAGLPSNSAHAS